MGQELEQSPQAYRHIAELKSHILRQRVLLNYVLDTSPGGSGGVDAAGARREVSALLRSMASEYSNDYLTMP
jgi:hypothetical protein